MADLETGEGAFVTKKTPMERCKLWRGICETLNLSKKAIPFQHERPEAKEITSISDNVQDLVNPNVQHVDYGAKQEELVTMSKERDLSVLDKFGGAAGLAEKLKSDLVKGIPGNDKDIMQRKDVFGSNIYPLEKGRSFWLFLWEAYQHLAYIPLIVVAVTILALGIKSEGIKQGWYDGGSILFVLFLVSVVTAISNYRQYLQFQNLNERRNIDSQVTRGGTLVRLSIFDIVVGDVITLKIGDQVPANGVLISGSLEIEESSTTGKCKIDSESPFLMSGCKVADGYGTMMVTSVGINMEWAMLISSISEDTVKKTSLLVHLNGLATSIGMVGLIVSIVFFVLLLARFFTGHGTPQFMSGKTSTICAIHGVIKIVTLFMTVLVVAVPGVPLAIITLILACSIKEMMRDKALFRRLSACETMGRATTICSDIIIPNQVCMVTGDDLQTAKVMALESGILDVAAKESSIIEGISFRNKSELEREAIAEKIVVMARCSPDDKLLLVQALKRKGHVVAVTGDVDNDDPALCEADIGLAKGVTGTKEGADIIILDDSFDSVVKVVRWGRSLYANIQKVIQFQLTINVAALIIDVVAATSTGDIPLNAVQLLWVNLIMKTLGPIALATESPTDHLMHRPPVLQSDHPVTNIMWRNLLIQAVYQVSVLLLLNFKGQNISPLRHVPIEHLNNVKNTLIFNAFVLCQIFNKFNARKPDQLNIFEGVLKNRFFMGIIALTLILQIMIVEFLGKFASTVRLSWQLWLICIVIGFFSWPVAFLGKLMSVPKTTLSNYIKCCPRLCGFLVSSLSVGVVIIILWCFQW